jgi:hypothetical protein
MAKPTGGWKANAYVIFDYFSPTDFRFAGIDVSTNKRAAAGRADEGVRLCALGAGSGSSDPLTWTEYKMAG